MKYKYPKISNCLTFRRTGADTAEIIDYLTGNCYTLNIEAARYAKKLDGKTHPFRIPTVFTRKQINELIQSLDECDLLRERDTRIEPSGTFLKTVWEPKWTRFLRVIACLWNALLLVSWLPILIIGIHMFVKNLMHMGFEMMWLGNILGLVVGVVLHEFGHAFAGVAYGARVFEVGVLIMYYVIPGAYVLLDDKNVKKRMKRIQIKAAGVETNLMLTGIFLLLGAAFTQFGGVFLVAALNNALLAMFNLTLIKGLDGTAIISELFGVENIIDKARTIVLSRKKRRKMISRGISGYATVVICYILSVLQIALPLILITNILEVISWFI